LKKSINTVYRLPFGQVPILQDSDRPDFLLAQSKSIARYLANLGNLVPTNLEDAAKCEMLIDGLSVRNFSST